MERKIISSSLNKQNLPIKLLSYSLWKKSTIVEIIALLFVILFLYTGISKLIEYTVFKEQIAKSPILKPVAPFLAWMLPLTEFVVSLLLFIPRWRLKGLHASFALMIAFTLYIIAIMSFSKRPPCSCGGIIELLSLRGHLIFNTMFTILAFAGILFERQIKATRNNLNG